MGSYIFCIKEFRWPPHPVLVTTKDNGNTWGGGGEEGDATDWMGLQRGSTGVFQRVPNSLRLDSCGKFIRALFVTLG